MTQFYIGVKQVTAWPLERNGEPGYGVKYEDGYQSWSPKDVFERAYLPMGEGNDGSTITPQMVSEFVARTESQTVGEKTTVAQVTLANGFEIVESSSCVDPANYDADLGRKICLDRAQNKIWELLGFLLQAARNGFKS